MYITRAAAKALQALKEKKQESSSDSEYTGPKVKQISPSIEKPTTEIPLPQPLIPPSINTSKEPIVEPLQEPLDQSKPPNEP